MGAAFDYVAVLKDNDFVGVADGGESVSNYKGCAAGHKAVHSLFYQSFGTGINRRSCFVKDENRWICNGCAGNG